MTITRSPVAIEAAPPRRRSHVLATFAFGDFRLLWSGLLISNLGTWMQFTALGYAVVQLAGSAKLASLDVGILGACNAVPALLLSPVAGVVADRYPRRRVLFVTNVTTSVVALSLAILASAHHLGLWNIFVLSSLRSATQSFDAPARQSWVPLLVPREFLGNAIGLNSIAFNAPSVLGPPLAGLLILSTGIAASFYVNAFATLAVVLALAFMKPPAPSSAAPQNLAAAIAAGIRFLAGHTVLRPIVLMLVVTCALVRPYSQLLPAYAAHVVHVDARGLGLLFAASGFGAILGSTVTAIVGSRRRGTVWFVSAAGMSLGVFLLGFVHSYAVALVVLVGIGLCVLSFAGSSNVLLQTLSPDHMRGRAISVFSMIILGVVPLGSLLLGSLASMIGLPLALTGGGAASLVLAVAVFLRNAELQRV
ncbi:MAG: MFS transporter [Candidatus Eremiobacteraeota bacterium]|nr:MFS transporter [Candidatus Eremiobacteraeota bacterium]